MSTNFYQYLQNNRDKTIRVLGINEAETVIAACNEVVYNLSLSLRIGVIIETNLLQGFHSAFFTMNPNLPGFEIVDSESMLQWGSSGYDRLINVDIFMGSATLCKTRSWYNSRKSDFFGVEYFDQSKDIVTNTPFHASTWNKVADANYIISVPFPEKSNLCPRCSSKLEKRVSQGLFGQSFDVLKCDNCGYCN